MANQAFRDGQHQKARRLYESFAENNPRLAFISTQNISIIENREKSQKGKSGNEQSLAGVLNESTRESEFARMLSHIAQNAGKTFTFDAIQSSEAELSETISRLASTSVTPLVSVIMPTYNRGEIICKAIHSVLDQKYHNWELFVCDDASSDDTEGIVLSINDKRIHYLKLPKKGAAAARNAGLAKSNGAIIAYLDSDNYWHPLFLSRMVFALNTNQGHSAAYADFLDFEVRPDGTMRMRSHKRPRFNHEKLLEKNFIDLNTFVHLRELFDVFGGFDERLTRRQDYDLIIKYTWLRDPIHVENILALYQRNSNLEQITQVRRNDNSCVPIIDEKISHYLSKGLPNCGKRRVKKVTIISWDLCRNHFSKPFALAEALSERYEVQLISFRFFEDPIFPPLEHVIPTFETVYLPGGKFPNFFESMQKALKIIDGDIIYTVKPRLPSLGLALLANQLYGVPIILEINDLETVVGSPDVKKKHTEITLGELSLDEPDLISPFGNLWSQVMDPLSKNLPVLVTHNHNIDSHYGNQCLYMRNLKDEVIYEPSQYDRAELRATLGFDPEDRVILFGGLIRKHKGIYELVELIKRLEDPRYKLLFVGSRITPDQTKLVEEYGTRIRVLPPQNREAMARINHAVDIVILWLNPEVLASHYQMPYKATDAFAMGPSVIANEISDLGLLASQGYLRIAPFGDWKRMKEVICEIYEQPDETNQIRDAARRLYLRQFSYAAARSNFELAVHRAFSHSAGSMKISAKFAEDFNSFYRSITGLDDDFIQLHKTHVVLSDEPLGIPPYGDADEDDSIIILDVQSLDSFFLNDPAAVTVVMPSIDISKALNTARLLLRRAGMPTSVCIVEDTLRAGFIHALNKTASKLRVKYVVYLAEDAFPSINWLDRAYKHLDKTGKGLLAFNCGKWAGRIAAFGMVRLSWIHSIYENSVLYSGYKAHKADNEITVIARALNQFDYEPDCVLLEIDPSKTGVNKETASTSKYDRSLFLQRFKGGFDNLLDKSAISLYWDEYLDRQHKQE
ncbi:glycosyltransferase [Synechococcus sp. UW140]|uniref:glycosyltransferase n=1 Tax=Synechococcus sp. UW140 TaxID=368503 RepID=UPI003137759D